MRIYIAGSFARQEQLRLRAEQLEELGATIVSSWLTEVSFGWYVPMKERAEVSPLSKNYGVQRASNDYDKDRSVVDINDIESCDILVLQSEDYGAYTSGGRLVEFGYAAGRGKDVAVIGRRENIFHYWPWVRHFWTWDDFYAYVGQEVVPCLS